MVNHEEINFDTVKVVYELNRPHNIVLTTGEHDQTTFDGISVSYNGRKCSLLEITTYKKQDFAIYPFNYTIIN